MGKPKNNYFNATLSDKLFDAANVLVMCVVLVVTLYPFLNVLAISFNDSNDTVRGGLTIFPREFTLKNYETIFAYQGLVTGFWNSVLRTVIGTLLGLLSGSMLAYCLARPDFQARKFVSTFLALTMYVTGGLIPVYILMRDLHLMNSFGVYVLPGLVSAFNVFVIRSFIDGLPYALQESAKIDGATDFRIYWQVILPLCKPVLATIALFLAVGQWNSWFDTYLYNGGTPSLTTLQYELTKVLQSTTNQSDIRGKNITDLVTSVSPESIKMAITIVVSLPILVIYPFLQRYFVKGMTLGAVKS
ncbi:carbohydrate ABC transporter permease [Paenibacillus sp. MMS18-CY102]|uniref:carbohydrate ABC transporter permease n=1 Tax=Paenibacillus sp. MMS18-CY102 TaxID=2682849 RepID=UPI001365CB18|nr:carbohydrate ABC transporter permease [Paenibacillus sp. MMS18-CY102]MWC29475.1 ABC transporter permease subunit [Paenibacillus sp. MMS18-CY102]